MKKILLFTAALSLAFTSCMRDGDWDDCPGGETRIIVYAERFQSEEGLSIPENSEALFNTRIEDLSYSLYRNGTLVETGDAEDILTLSGQTWLFTRSDLANGEYNLVLRGNTAVLSRAVDFAQFDMDYPGYDLTRDYFINRFDFNVNSQDDKQYTTQLKRVHGVVRLNFINLPDHVTGIEIELDGLSARSHLDGTYSNPYTLSRRLPHDELLRDENNDFTFSVLAYPTLPEQKTCWQVRLYRDGSEEPFYDECVMADLQVVRNDLLDLTMDFSQEDIRFYVGLDDQWDGWHQVGGPVLN